MSALVPPVPASSARLAADVWQRALVRRKVSPRAADAALILAASLVVAGLAQVAISLPFTPVPITGQTLGVLLAALLLGPRRATIALSLYLVEGAVGFPVFAEGSMGVGKLVGPTAGYLWSFPIAAYLVGTLAARGWDRKPVLTGLAMSLGTLLILTLGTLWLSLFVGGLAPAFVKGFAPFIVGGIVKMAMVAALLPVGWRLPRREQR